MNVLFKLLKLLVPQLERFISLGGRRVLDFGWRTGEVSVAARSPGAYAVGVAPTFTSVRAAAVRAGLHGLAECANFIHLPDASYQFNVNHIVMAVQHFFTNGTLRPAALGLLPHPTPCPAPSPAILKAPDGPSYELRWAYAA